VRFGLGLGADLEGDNFFNLAASYRRTWINSLGAEWRADAQIGETTRFFTEFYQPLQTRHFGFVAPQAEVGRRTVDIYDGSNRFARYDFSHAIAGVDVGSSLTKYGEARIGPYAGIFKTSLDTGPAELLPPGDRFTVGGIRLRAVLDQLDNANFPRNGASIAGEIRYSTKVLGADDDYIRWEVDGTAAYSIGPHALQLGMKAGGQLGNNPLPVYDQFQWGGFLQQSGYPTGALFGQQLMFGRLVYTYRLLHNQLLDGLYVGASLELGRMRKPLVATNSTDLLTSGAVFIGADTPLGPFYLGFGAAADGNQSAYLFLGRP
jgi:NTE family protein